MIIIDILFILGIILFFIILWNPYILLIIPFTLATLFLIKTLLKSWKQSLTNNHLDNK